MSNDNAKTKNERSNATDMDVGSTKNKNENENLEYFTDVNIEDGNDINNVNKTIGHNFVLSGPYIPEVDYGYNLTTNGVSINFLKNPFCFKNDFLFGKKHFYLKKNNDNKFSNKQNFYMIKDEFKILKPLVQTNIVKVPKYIYKENILHKTETETKKETIVKNLCIPHDAPIYVTREVKIPIYKEEIKYVPTIIEKERVYEIPKLEINELIQENLLFFHKNKIQYKKHNHVVERVIPKLKKCVIEKTIQIPSITKQDISNITTPITPINLPIQKNFSSDITNISENITNISENISNKNYLKKLKNASTDNPCLYKNKKQGLTRWEDSQTSKSINGQLVKQMSTLTEEHTEEHTEKIKINESKEKEKEKEKEENVV